MSKIKKILIIILQVSVFILAGIGITLLIKSCIPNPSYPAETLEGVVI